MQNADNRATMQSGGRDDTYRSVVADLVDLMERMQASLGLLESAIANEAAAAREDIGADIVVLDDITPGYAKAGTALQACAASLGLALHMLQGPTQGDTGDQAGNRGAPCAQSAAAL